MRKNTKTQNTVSPWATLPLGPKISQKQCCSSYVLKISVVQGIISVAQEILQKTVKSALLKVNTELFKNRVVSRTALLEVVLLKDLLYWYLIRWLLEKRRELAFAKYKLHFDTKLNGKCWFRIIIFTCFVCYERHCFSISIVYVPNLYSELLQLLVIVAEYNREFNYIHIWILPSVMNFKKLRNLTCLKPLNLHTCDT